MFRQDITSPLPRVKRSQGLLPVRRWWCATERDVSLNIIFITTVTSISGNTVFQARVRVRPSLAPSALQKGRQASRHLFWSEGGPMLTVSFILMVSSLGLCTLNHMGSLKFDLIFTIVGCSHCYLNVYEQKVRHGNPNVWRNIKHSGKTTTECLQRASRPGYL